MRFRDSVDLVVLAAFWGASFLFMRIAVPEFGPVVLAQLRVTIAALFLLPILLLRSDTSELIVHWKILALLGVLNSAIPFYLLSFSTLHLSGGFASILNATAPLWAAVVAWLWLSALLDRYKISGLLLGFAGVLILVWNKVSFATGASTLAIFAAIGAAAFYGIGANLARKYVSGISSLAVATGSMIAASLFLLPGAVILWPADSVTTGAWAAVIAMGVVSTGIAYALYFRLIANVGPAKAVAVTYLVPVFAVIWGTWLLDEAVTVTMLVGSVIILLGTALATGMLPRKGASGTDERRVV
jgi:drug/metabolite transporter (DMT)-like permease